jgi:hypothetical protein
MFTVYAEIYQIEEKEASFRRFAFNNLISNGSIRLYACSKAETPGSADAETPVRLSHFCVRVCHNL